MMIGPRVTMIGPYGPTDFEKIVRTKGRLIRLPERRDRWPEPSVPVTTVPVTKKPEAIIMKTNNTTLKSRNTSVMAGIDKHITTSIIINGTAFTQADLKAVFQSHITAITTNEALHKSLADGVVNARAIGVKVNTTYQLLRSALIAQYGKNANAILNDFGMTAPKAPGARTVDAKATAKAKRTATRAARHTMGSVQKKGVTGNVVGINVTPVIAGPTVTTPPAQPTAPAPVAPVTTTPTAPTAGATSAVAPGASTPHAG